MRWGKTVAALLSSALLRAGAAHASPQDLFSFGPRSFAMGGLGATFSEDFGAVHANPAGLSRAREAAFSLGYVGTLYDLSVGVGAVTPSHFSVDAARATTIGIVAPLPFGGILRDRIALGVGFYTPTNVVVRGRILRPDEPQFINIADRTQSVALQIGLGVHVWRGLRVGVGIAALAAITGTVLVATDATGRAGSRVDTRLIASYAPIVGASYDAGPLRFGATFRGTLVGRFDIDITTRDLGISLPVLNIEGIAQYDPWQLAGEASYVRGPWTLAVGATFRRWSDYPGAGVATTVNSPRPPAPAFRDTVTPRLGAEYRWSWPASHLALRGGYFYDPTPAPLAEGVANYLDNDRHAFTFGTSIGGRLAGTYLTVDMFAQLHALVARTATKLPEIARENPGAPTITYGGTMLFLGITASVTF